MKAKLYTLKAKNIFTTTGYEMFYGFTNGANIIELWHGMPLKKILRDDEFSSAGLNKNLLYRILHSLNNKCYHITLCGSESVKKFSEMKNEST